MKIALREKLLWQEIRCLLLNTFLVPAHEAKSKGAWECTCSSAMLRLRARWRRSETEHELAEEWPPPHRTPRLPCELRRKMKTGTRTVRTLIKPTRKCTWALEANCKTCARSCCGCICNYVKLRGCAVALLSF